MLAQSLSLRRDDVQFLAILTAVFKALSAWIESRQREADRKAGRDEVRADTAEKTLESVAVANRIDNADLPDSLLLPPDKRG